jgi:hypothetical protein
MRKENNMAEKEFLIRWDVIRVGQVGKYTDSIYEYKVYSDKDEGEVETFCRNFIKPASHKAIGNDSFSGRCGFPYGLESYYDLKKIGENTYRYLVCYPYNG